MRWLIFELLSYVRGGARVRLLSSKVSQTSCFCLFYLLTSKLYDTRDVLNAILEEQEVTIDKISHDLRFRTTPPLDLHQIVPATK